MTGLALTVRDFEPQDLGDLDWSGGPEHLHAMAEALQASFSGDTDLLVITLANGRLVAAGAVDFSRYADAGRLWMLSVHETVQGLGLGTRLVGALEGRIVDRGLTLSRLGVEHDNPRAAALYRRLGYRDVGSSLDCWPIGGNQSYVTVCTLLERDLTSQVDVDSRL